MRAAALLIGLLMAGSASAAPAGALSMSTGIRPLGLPLSEGLGGSLRAGLELGRVRPFLGGGASVLRVTQKDYDQSIQVALWTAQLGARVRMAELEGLQTYVVGGALLSGISGGTVWDEQRNNRSSTHLRVGPGAFAGGGADAFVSDRVSLGVEAGLVGGSLKIIDRWSFRNRENEYEYGDGSFGLFTYASIGFTVWTGGDR